MTSDVVFQRALHFPVIRTVSPKINFTTVKGAVFQPGEKYSAVAPTHKGGVWELFHPRTEERACFTSREVRVVSRARAA